MDLDHGPRGDAPSPPPPPPPVPLWERWGSGRLLLLTVGLLLADTAVQVAVMAATGRLFLAAGLGSLAALLLLRAVVRARGDRCRRFCAWRRPDPVVPAAVLLVAAGCWYPVALLSSWSARLHPPPPEFLALLRNQLPRTAGGAAVAAIAVVLVAPLAEEVLFRGLLHRIARRWWPPLAAATLSGLVFALLHGEPWYLFGLAVLGVLLGLVFELAGTLLAPWLLHAAFNAVSFWLMLRHPESLAAPAAAPSVHPGALAASLAAVAAGLAWLARRGRAPDA